MTEATATSEVVDADVVEPGAELVPQQPSGTLFRSDDPVEVMNHAAAIANVLKDVLRKQKLTSNIQGREHVLVEGWTTCGAMLGIVPVVVWTRKLENGWEARVEARTLDGRTIGAAEASCTRDEKTWGKRDDYAIRSMAQTRATSKALRGPLGFIVTLAGFEATPTEEMPAVPPEEPQLPHGPPHGKGLNKVIGAACTKLADNDPRKGKALYELIVKDCGGYFPLAAAHAVIRCANTENLVPHVVAPEPE